jgi:hypothetical protein
MKAMHKVEISRHTHLWRLAGKRKKVTKMRFLPVSMFWGYTIPGTSDTITSAA